MLVHLREVERRHLYITDKTASLWAFVHKELHYSEQETQNRISAMRLLRELPELEDQLQNGELSMTQLNQAKNFFNSEEKAGKPLTPEAKADVMKKLEGQSTDQTGKTLLGLSSEPERKLKKREGKRNLTEKYAEYRFTGDQEFEKDLELLRGLLAHRHPEGQGLGELMRAAVQIALEKLDPARKKPRAKADETVAPFPEEVPGPVPSAAQKRAVYQRAQTACERIHPESGQRCGSHYRLEIHHIVAHSRGGPTRLDNLILLCHACHHRETLRTFGAEKIAQMSARGRPGKTRGARSPSAQPSGP